MWRWMSRRMGGLVELRLAAWKAAWVARWVAGWIDGSRGMDTRVRGSGADSAEGRQAAGSHGACCGDMALFQAAPCACAFKSMHARAQMRTPSSRQSALTMESGSMPCSSRQSKKLSLYVKWKPGACGKPCRPAMPEGVAERAPNVCAACQPATGARPAGGRSSWTHVREGAR
eukprot:189838-Chlamydomonas_euryale.AAC.16